MIRSPYNFVPLNKQVFIPEWGNQVSHDIPFSDSESGTICFRITSLTPIHVSGGKTIDCNGNETHSSVFCHINDNGEKRYFIPGSTIKGMIRSVAEILCFAKLSQFNDDYFGYRIFRNPKSDDYKHYHTEMDNPFCGYLKREDDKYIIIPCGKPEKIHIDDITPEKLEEIEREGRKLVMSGSMDSKKHEHIFNQKIEGRKIEVPEVVIKKFVTIYKPNKNFENILTQLKSGAEIPVFYHLDGNKNVKTLGLSRNYRLPYKMNVAAAIVQSGYDWQGKSVNGRDMVELLFGYAEKKESLKGRVHIGHAFCTTRIEENAIAEVSGVLGTPQASYTPLYLRQDTPGCYKSYNNVDAEIAGRKRYRIHSDEYLTQIPQGNGNDNVLTHIKYLPPQTSFDVTITLHNLRPSEVGLILSALTFHNTSGTHHNMGMGKSYGYGKINIDNIHIDGFSENCIDKYLKEFEKTLYLFTYATQNLAWGKTPQIKKLMAIASDHSRDLEMMTLDEYKDSTQNSNYSRITEADVNVNELVTYKEYLVELNKRKEELEEIRRQEEEMLENIRRQEEEQQMAITNRITVLLQEIKTLCDNKKFEEAKAKCIEANMLIPECVPNDMMEKIERMLAASSETIEQFAEGLKIASLPAFAGRCKKRIDAGKTFCISDMTILAKKIKEALGGNKKLQKEWYDDKNWRKANLSGILGDDIANELLRLVKN